MIRTNQLTIALAAAGLVSLPAALYAEEKALEKAVTSLSSTILSGYVDTSAQWNLGTGNGHTPPYAFGGNQKADGFNLNVAKIMLESPVQSDGTWNAGYKADLIFGPDANTLFTQSSGVAADFGVKQAYVALHSPIGNGLDAKVGVWDTFIGYEVFESYANPHATHSYGYTIEPTTHTGVLLSYQFAPFLSANVGVANTVGPNINARAFPTGAGAPLDGPKAESYKTYMAGVTLTAPEEWGWLGGSTLSGVVINGFNSLLAGGEGNQTSWYVGALFNTPVERLKIGASYDYLGVSDQPSRSSGYANATAIYASYKLTEKATLLARGEYATSDLGVLGADRVIAATGTLQYDLWKNVLSRIEFRWDHAADGSNAYGGATPSDPATLSNSYILMANLVYRF